MNAHDVTGDPGVGDEAALSFGQRLRRLREAAGLTQEELAARAGLSGKAIGALERGARTRPYPHTVRALADALGLAGADREALMDARPARERDRAVAPVRATPPALPAAPTALIGRERELAELAALLTSGSARLVTLTGPGGVGKTRLALELAGRLADAFRAGVAFVPLAPLADPDLVLPTVAQTLGLAEAGTASAGERLVTHLAAGRWLLVLDNAEHVVAGCAGLAELLAACPGLHVLVTSRAPLRLRAEREAPLRPLALPDLGQLPTPEEIAEVGAVRLFVERAQAVAPSFALTQANCAAVAAICRRLDGLPLALELVAARVRALSPTELLARLDDLLPLLAGGARDLPARQQTMHAAIEWSERLLGPAERALFRRLAIFAGGWTLDAAEAVTAWGEVAPWEVAVLLAQLVEQSLVTATPEPDGATRYALLEPIRQYAAGRIAELGERDELADRHLDWCIALAERALPELTGPDQQPWLERLEQEHDNLRAALAWSQQDPARGERGLRLAGALWRFWLTRAHLSEGRRWLESALAANPDAPGDLRTRAINGAGGLARDQGDIARAIELHEQNLVLQRALGDTLGVGISLNNLANAVGDQGDNARATTLYEEALAIFRAEGSDWEIALGLHNLGMILGYRGEHARGEALLEEALDYWNRIGEAGARARTLDALGDLARNQGALDRAASLHAESLALRRQIGEARAIAVTLKNLGLVARDRGEFAEATRLLEESLQLRRALGDELGAAITLAALGDTARLSGEIAGALPCYRESLALHRRLAVNLALPLCLRGAAALVSASDPALAARLLGASEGIRERISQSPSPADRADLARVTAAIRARLAEDELARQLAAGHALAAAEAIDAALGALRGAAG